MVGSHMFELRLLGQFQMTGPSGPIELTSPKLCALLGYLACHVPRHETRERLAALLWGSHFEAQAQQNLRRHLHGCARSSAPRRCRPAEIKCGCRTAQYQAMSGVSKCSSQRERRRPSEPRPHC